MISSMKNIEWHRIELRLDKELFNRLNNFCKKHNFSKSSFIRSLIKFFTTEVNGEALIIRDDIYKKKLMYQVHCYGNNLNQIAHKLNIAIKSNELPASDLIDVKNIFILYRRYISVSIEMSKWTAIGKFMSQINK